MMDNPWSHAIVGEQGADHFSKDELATIKQKLIDVATERGGFAKLEPSAIDIEARKTSIHEVDDQPGYRIFVKKDKVGNRANAVLGKLAKEMQLAAKGALEYKVQVGHDMQENLWLDVAVTNKLSGELPISNLNKENRVSAHF